MFFWFFRVVKMSADQFALVCLLFLLQLLKEMPEGKVQKIQGPSQGKDSEVKVMSGKGFLKQLYKPSLVFCFFDSRVVVFTSYPVIWKFTLKTKTSNVYNNYIKIFENSGVKFVKKKIYIAVSLVTLISWSWVIL